MYWQIELCEIKNFCIEKEMIHWVNWQPTEWESIFVAISDKGLIIRKYILKWPQGTKDKQPKQSNTWIMKWTHDF